MRILYRTPRQRAAIRNAAAPLELPAAEIDVLVRYARLRTWADGSHLARLGRNGDAVHLIVDGTAAVRTAAGAQPNAEVGAVIGELYAYRVRWYQLADVVCIGPVCTITLPVAAWRTIEASCPVLTARVAEMRDLRVAVLDAAMHVDQMRRWEQYQTAVGHLHSYAAR
jgi:hypothetical protein